MPDEQLVRGVREFVAREIAPEAEHVDRSGQLPPDRWRKMGEHGIMGLMVPSEWGGVGADMSTVLAAIEAIAAGCGSTAWAYLAHCTACTAILAAGTEAQKDRYLPALADGRMIGAAMVVTETGGGSNHESIRTIAREEGDSYVLDGSKFFITQAGAADVYLVLARTGETSGPISCFLVEKDDGGLTFGSREETMGLRGVEIREMVFDGCRVPASRMLGPVGGGVGVMGAGGGFPGIGAAAAALGLAQAAVEATRKHLKERTVLGQPLGSIPGVQAQMGEVQFDMVGARAWLEYALAWRSQGAKGPPVPAWMAKVAVTEAALRVIDRCMALHGAVGYSRALPLERYYRDARAFCVHWGINDVLRSRIGQMASA